jgi:hypothetical protein
VDFTPDLPFTFQGTIAEAIPLQGLFSPVVFSQRRQNQTDFPRSLSLNTSMNGEWVSNDELRNSLMSAGASSRILQRISAPCMP